MRTPEEFAEDAGIGVDNCGDLSREDLAEVIRERDAEEVAREVLGCRLTLADDGRNVCEIEHGGAWDCADEEQRIADLIRDRDAEVRAATLAEFEVETRTMFVGPHNVGPRRRLVGPWQPVES